MIPLKRIIAINGSPRKNGNTATLLDKALEGAKASGPDDVVTECIDLYDLNYSGCRSCFACKRIGGKSYGKCAVQDDLHAVLEKVLTSDGIIIGSPIYYRNITGGLHSFLERSCSHIRYTPRIHQELKLRIFLPHGFTP